jgi:uncharacterized protein (DUF1330 family)
MSQKTSSKSANKRQAANGTDFRVADLALAEYGGRFLNHRGTESTKGHGEHGGRFLNRRGTESTKGHGERRGIF